jgi:membrane protein DedA with SNARE-associated domain
MLPRMLQGLISHWGYLAVALGAFFEGEAVLLGAGALAHGGQLSLPLVVLAGTVGSFSWGQAWFYAGRTFGRAFIDRRPSWRARAAIVEQRLWRHGGWLVVGFRFIAGMAIILPVLIGACGYRARRFLFLDGMGALLWASLFAAIGFGMSAGLEVMLARSLGWPEIIAIGVLGVLLVWLVTRLVSAALVRSKAGSAAL